MKKMATSALQPESLPYVQRSGIDLTLNGALFRCVGVDKVDLLWNYLGTDTGGSTANATRALADAANSSIPFFRIAATPYWPNSFSLWLQNASAYWSKFDQMVNASANKGIRLIPEVMHNQWLFSDITKEPLSQLFNSSSKTYSMLTNYTYQLVTRYRNSSVILFWELANELNNLADLDFANYPNINIAPSLGTPASRTSLDNFSTDQMIDFTRNFASFIKQLDPNHPITTGFSIPRLDAQHLRMKPEWSPGGGDYTSDTFSEFQQYLKDTNPDPIDFVSIHFYNNPGAVDDGNSRFGVQGQFTADVLNYVKNATDYIGKPLWIGEFADANPKISVNPYANFTQNVLLKVLRFSIPTSAIWDWETTNSGLQNYTLRPGKTDFIIAKIAETNHILGCPLLSPVGFSVSLYTSPPRGAVTINGTAYASGYWYRYQSGRATLTANPPAGYHFSSWNSTGGVTITNREKDPTQVVITGPGTLTSYSTPKAPSPITPVMIFIVAVTTLGAPILRRRRR